MIATELVPDALDGNPNHSQACGKTATATYNGKSITIGIVDRCYACGYDDIDLAPAAFQQFADLGESKTLKLHVITSTKPLHRRREALWLLLALQLN